MSETFRSFCNGADYSQRIRSPPSPLEGEGRGSGMRGKKLFSEPHNHRHMIGRAIPAACFAQNFDLGQIPNHIG